MSGDEASDVLVYAQCAAEHRFGRNGTITVFAANPSTSAVSLQLSLPARPRVEYVLTAPGGNLSSRTPVLNGQRPLSLSADGSLPPMDGHFCGQTDCEEVVTLPPLSQGFFVLLGAAADAVCMTGTRLK